MSFFSRQSIVLTLSVCAVLASPLLSTTAEAGNLRWRVTRTQWTAGDEKNYQNFIQALGDSKCQNVADCLKSPANPYRASDPAGFDFWADCGRFPYLLRAYFAWKNGLPFSVASAVSPVGGPVKDIRYSINGNFVTHRMSNLDYGNHPGWEVVQDLAKLPSTAMYRYNAEQNDEPTRNFYDFAPARVDRQGVRPGTIIYDANGHAAIVYRIENDGRIRFFDAHTDALVTRSVYGEKFERSSPNSGGGFKNWRPLYLNGARQAADGSFVGGVVQTIPMSSLGDYSMEQYYGTVAPASSFKGAQFTFNGQTLQFYDWVRSRMSIGDLKYHPVEEMLNMMDTLCSDVKDRVNAVDAAVQKGIAQKPEPDFLPDNIYGASDEWESFSSPSRDARLKTSFVELRQSVQRFVELYRQGSPRIIYSGSNLALDLRNAFETAANNCQIIYTRTDGTRVRLGYNHVVARLYNLSFDPYQCPERRWGADTQQELATCPYDQTKEAWYQAEQRLRNQIDRTYDVKMGFSLQDLQSRVPGSGVDFAPDADLRKYLWSL